MGEIKIPCIFYLYLHSKICERTKGNIIVVKEVRRYMSEWRIPKKIRYLMIKELELLGLIKINRNKIELEKPLFSEENCNKYCEMLGIF